MDKKFLDERTTSSATTSTILSSSDWLETTTFISTLAPTTLLLEKDVLPDTSAERSTNSINYLSFNKDNFQRNKKNLPVARPKKSSLEIDPCDEFECETYTVPGPFCTYYTKGLYDVDCFLPCLTENCTTEIQYATFCPKYECRYLPGPSPIFPPKPNPPSENWTLIGLIIGGTKILVN